MLLLTSVVFKSAAIVVTLLFAIWILYIPFAFFSLSTYQATIDWSPCADTSHALVVSVIFLVVWLYTALDIIFSNVIFSMFCLWIFPPKNTLVASASDSADFNTLYKIKSVCLLLFPYWSITLPCGILSNTWFAEVSKFDIVTVYSTPYCTCEVVPFVVFDSVNALVENPVIFPVTSVPFTRTFISFCVNASFVAS